MDRSPFLILLLVAIVLLMLVMWGVYDRMTALPPPAREPATQPLIERIQAERERRMQQQQNQPATTSP